MILWLIFGFVVVLIAFVGWCAFVEAGREAEHERKRERFTRFAEDTVTGQ